MVRIVDYIYLGDTITVCGEESIKEKNEEPYIKYYRISYSNKFLSELKKQIFL